MTPKIRGLLWSCCIQPHDQRWVAKVAKIASEGGRGMDSAVIQTSLQIQQYVPIVSFLWGKFFFAYWIYCLLGPHPTYCLWWSIIACRCLNNKSHITCVCKMVINNATVPRDHRWILTYHLRQFPENVALLLPMGSRSVQVFYNLCRKKIETVCQCPESEG